MDCRFYEWHDDPNTPFVTGLLGDLRDAINRLRNQNRELQEARIQAEGRIQDVEMCARSYVHELQVKHAREVGELKTELGRRTFICKCVVMCVVVALFYMFVK